MKRIILSWLLILVMVVAMLSAITIPVSASLIPVYVNGINIAVDADHTINCGAGTAVYDLTTSILTLANATIDTPFVDDSGNSYGIYKESSNLTINVTSGSSINLEPSSTTASAFGIYTSGNLTISGSALTQLNVTSDEGAVSFNSYGIYTGGTLSLSNINSSITGYAFNNNVANSYGIYSAGNITVTDSILYVRAQRATNTNTGIYSGGNITITNNDSQMNVEVNADCDGYAVDPTTSYGIYAAGTLTVSDSRATPDSNDSLKAKSNADSATNCAIYAGASSGALSISNMLIYTTTFGGSTGGVISNDGHFIAQPDGTTMASYTQLLGSTGSNLQSPIQSAAPAFTNSTATKAAAYQQSVDYTLSTALSAGTLKVYGAASGGTVLTDVTTSTSGTALTLSSTGTDLAERDYWITFTETGKGESTRVQLTVAPSADVVLVASATSLAAIATAVNAGTDYSGKTIKQTADITLTGNWTPIGTSSGNHPFKGTYDGNGHTISGLNVPSGSAESGLFGLVVDANIKNLIIDAPTVSGAGHIGALAGEVDSISASAIQNVAVVGGTVTSTGNYTGGLIGQTSANGTLTISGCYTTGDISGTTHVGGIVGNFVSTNATSSIENCYALGDITASGGFAGGITGYAYYQSVASVERIVNVFATGTVTATYNGGGIVGYANGNSSGSCLIDHAVALNEAIVNSTPGSNDEYFHRVVGEISTGTTLSNCYSFKNTTIVAGNYVDDITPTASAITTGIDGEGISKSDVNKASNWLAYLDVANGNTGYGKWTNGTHRLPHLTALSSDDTFAMPDHLAYKALNSDSAATRSYTVGNTTGIDVDNEIEVYGPAFSGAKISIQDYDAATDTVTWNLTGTSITVQQSGGQDIAVAGTTGTITFTGNDTAAHYQQVLRSVHFTTTATTGSRSISFSLGESAAFAGHYYEFVAFTAGTQKTWEQSRGAASRMEFGGQLGYLATIQSSDENAFIASKLGANGWIGAKGIMNGSVKEWKWVTDPDSAISSVVFFSQDKDHHSASYSSSMVMGTTAVGSYSNFNGGEPNGLKITPADDNATDTEWCGEVYSGGASAGRWNDLKNTGYASDANLTDSGSQDAKGYVVEFSIIPEEFVVTKTVNITAQSSGGGSGGGADSPIAEVNGQPTVSGTINTTVADNRTTTTVTVNQTSLSSQLGQVGTGAIVTIPFTQTSDVTVGELNGQMIKDMESKEAVLVIQTPTASYTLPASQINISAISEALGTDVTLSDIKVSVSISNPTDQTVEVVQQSADSNNLTLVVPAVDFDITCSYNGEIVDVSKFNTYVERRIAIPEGIDASKITTSIVVNPDGSTRHVPTQIIVVDGVYYAVINSLTNSTYAVIWHPYEFKDIISHWAKASINNMGSRMVVSGVSEGIYEPDRNMTRAEFATIIVKALGLVPGEGTKVFNDVRNSDWFCGYVKTAAEYSVIAGYNNGNFGPQDLITREQAMTMIARAMVITRLESDLQPENISKVLANYTDNGSISGYAINSIAECVKVGVVSGRTKTSIAPKERITRAEVAVIVERLLQKSDLID
ncbi:MAG: hypothetical protein EOM59_12760 [Clostridia bacterium]|nr:hypothetical protein [Clostridia bacterium]